MKFANRSNALTGRSGYFYDRLKQEIERAEEIKINVSFIRESGAYLISRDLKKQALQGADIKILTSDYLNITEPSALYLLQNELGRLADIRICSYGDEIAYHPKAYFITTPDHKILFIGSSNISYSAFYEGIEWNYRLEESRDSKAFQEFEKEFADLFNNHSHKLTDKFLKKYAAGWKKPEVLRVVDSSSSEIQRGEESKVRPRGAQHEALYELKLAREEGIKAGLVAAATGVGKTYLAAFDSLDFNRVLFVAHREEILRQARESYAVIREDENHTYFNGREKDPKGDVVFASVQTLRNEDYLEEYFSPEEFDYIVVDEFHHAAADSYLNVLNYFEPEFLLGLTATPYRMDNRDIFALCNDNLLYEIDLKDAINRDLLVPFKYYGIHDIEVDYDEITFQNGRYNSRELERSLSTHRRADLIYNNYRKLAGARTLGFCATINHARYMADYFSNRDKNLNAVCVHSSSDRGENFMPRDQAVAALNRGDIDIIFAVDIFNEGVDIPSLDTVLFLRPTESYVVFLQQLGRGLRKYEEKDYLTALDFIGNYKRAHYVPLLLAGINPLEDERRTITRPDDLDYPEGCQVKIDFEVLDLFKELKKSDPLEKRMADEYYRLKSELGHRPLRFDVYTGSDLETRHFLKRKYDDKDGYLRFLNEINELNDEEKGWLDTIVEDFLLELEKTSMAKSYKMPVLLALVKDGLLQQSVSLEKVGRSFMNFYRQHKLHQKDLSDKKHRNWQDWDQEKFKKEAVKNPVHFLSKRKYFIHDEVNQEFRLNSELFPYFTPLLTEHYLDIVKFRKTRYFKRRFK